MNIKFKEIYNNSIKEPEKFWEEVSKDVFWYNKPSKILNLMLSFSTSNNFIIIKLI